MTNDHDYPQMAAARGRIEAAPRRVRGFLGDPLGAYNDSKAQGSQLEQRRQSMLKRWQALEDRMHKVDAQEISIRATLSQRYNREFLKLDD